MIISRTPLRVSFAGGGTDFPQFYQYHGGEVIGTAIDKYVYVIVKRRYDRKIYLNWSQKEIVETVDQLEHELIREAMRKTGVADSVEIVTLSDIPSFGSGLGSSSAVTVGTLCALFALKGKMIPQSLLAEMACEIEIEALKKPIGKQDQYLTALGGMRDIAFHPCGQVDTRRVPIGVHPLMKHLLLFHTGISRRAETVLAMQCERTRMNTDTLLRLKGLVPAVKSAIRDHDYAQFGGLLDAGWSLKRTLADGIATMEIDAMYANARQAGAWGGKLLGAGGGGFLLVCAPPTSHEQIRKAVSLQEYPLGIDTEGCRIIFNAVDE